MLQVEINQVAASDERLSLGLVIRYGENGPVRFAQVHLEESTLDWTTMTAIGRFVTAQINRHLDSEKDIAEEADVPLF